MKGIIKMNKKHYLILASLGFFLCANGMRGENSTGAYVEGDYLLHPQTLFYKEEKVFIKANAYLAQKKGKDWKTTFTWKGGEKENKKKNEIILICDSEWPDAKGTRIKTLTPEGLSIEFKIKTKKGLGEGSHGLIAFYLPMEFLQENGKELICVSPQEKTIEIAAEKFSDIVLRPKENNGKFILRDGSRELIIKAENVDFTGSYGARIQDYREKPKDGSACLRFVISFNTLKPVEINAKVSFSVKDKTAKE
jgi:hypothetical protein